MNKDILIIIAICASILVPSVIAFLLVLGVNKRIKSKNNEQS